MSSSQFYDPGARTFCNWMNLWHYLCLYIYISWLYLNRTDHVLNYIYCRSFQQALNRLWTTGSWMVTKKPRFPVPQRLCSMSPSTKMMTNTRYCLINIYYNYCCSLLSPFPYFDWIYSVNRVIFAHCNFLPSTLTKQFRPSLNLLRHNCV